MAQTIKLKRSSTGGAVPSTSSLSLGEVAINTYDGKVYIKKNDGSDAIVEIGAGNGEAVWTSYDYTATSSQTSFTGSDNNSATLSYVPGFLQVFLNGVLLDPAVDYAATTGNSVVLTVGATTSDLLQIETFTQIIGTGDILVDTFPVSSTQTAFTLSQDPINKNNISVYVEGVYQESSTYSLSGTTLTLSESPANGTTVEVVIGTRNVTLDGIADLTISGTLHAGALDLGDANIINVNEISLDTIKGDADANTNITFAGSDVTTFTQGGTERLRLNTTGAQVTGNIVVSGTVDGRDVAADGATADAALPRAGGAMGGAITTNSTFDGRDVSVDGTKLDGIESGATADQTDVEIRAAVESASDSNVFTNADHSKLDAIEALADVTDATNVTAAGALMDSEVTNLAQVKAFASSDYATAAQGTTANAALPKAGGTMTGALTNTSYGSQLATTSFIQNALISTVANSSGALIRMAVSADSNPTYSFEDDTNTGMFTSGADTLNFTTAGSERLRIDSSGSVGIGTGTSALSYPLTVYSTGTYSAKFHSTTTATTAYNAILVTGGMTSAIGYYGIAGSTAGNTSFRDAFVIGTQSAHSLSLNTNDTARITVASSGNVGIGTASPAMGLHVGNAIGALFGPTTGASTYISPDHENTINGGYGLDSDTGDLWVNYRGYQNGTSRFRDFRVGNGKEGLVAIFDGSTGNVGIGNISPAHTLEIHNSATGDYTDFGLRGTGHKYVIGVGNDAVATVNDKWYLYDNDNGAFRMVVDTAGNVGIGETSPKAPGGAGATTLTLKGTSFPQWISVATAATANSTTWRSISRNSHVYQIQTVNDAITSEQTAYEISRGAGSNSISYQRWFAGTTEAMRIDSSGYVIVGGIVQGAQNALTISQAGYVQARATGIAGYFDRLGSDGTILQFRQGGTNVGSIGNNTDFYIASQDGTGVRFSATQVLPCSESGATQNGSRDLGASNARFKDLYLSGNVLAASPLLVGISSAAGVGGGASDINSAEVGQGYLNLNRDDIAHATQIQFGKNGAVVGRIHTDDRLSIGTGNTGIYFYNSGNSVLPYDNSAATPATRDAAIDLGSSGARFKDLYLSGEAKVTSTGVDGTYAPILRGVYSGNANETNTIETTVSSGAGNSGFKFNVSNGGGSSGQTEGLRITRSGTYAPLGIKLGGTGAANTLDDYEEGTFTPAVSGGGGTVTASTATGYYTKVGNLVTVSGTFTWSANGSNANGTSKMTGFPFASHSVSNGRSVGSFGAINGIAGANSLRFVCDPGYAWAYIITQNGTGYSHSNTFSASGAIYGFHLTYTTA